MLGTELVNLIHLRVKLPDVWLIMLICVEVKVFGGREMERLVLGVQIKGFCAKEKKSENENNMVQYICFIIQR